MENKSANGAPGNHCPMVLNTEPHRERMTLQHDRGNYSALLILFLAGMSAADAPKAGLGRSKQTKSETRFGKFAAKPLE